MKEILDFLPEKNYFIYGTGLFGQYCLDRISEKYGREAILGFIESAPKEKEILGTRVLSPQEAYEERHDDIGIIVTGFKSYETMKQNLLDTGFDDDSIILLNEYEPYFNVGYQNLVNRVCFYPEVELSENSDELIKKIQWFIPDRIEVSLPTKIQWNDIKLNPNIRFVDEDNYEEALSDADIILLHSIKEDSIVRRFPEKIRVVDKDFYMTVDADNYDQLYYYSFSEQERGEMVNRSKKIYVELKKCAEEYKKTNVFCTGPSIGEIFYHEQEFSNEFNIICNSMVKSHRLMDVLDPRLITFADTDFFVSPSEYADAFYKDLLQEYMKRKMYIAVRDRQKPLILAHYPQLADRMMGIPYSYESDIWFIDEDRFFLKPMANVFADMMLPIASSLFDNIGIVGCTGRNPDETYFWEHNEEVQYLDLKPSVFEMWRGFFSNRRYDVYFDRHCGYVDALIRYGESLKKRYYNYTTSFIPVLQRLYTPKVSIITVCKNSSSTISQTIESVIGQSYPRIEYIVIDGASTDGTKEIVEQYGANICVYESSPDNGIYYAMNKGISRATGTIVGILNSDDWYEPDAIEKVVEAFRDYETDIVYGFQNMVHANGNKTKAPNRELKEIFHGIPMGHPAVFVKKQIYDKYGVFDTDYSIVADHELMLRFYINGAEFREIPNVLVNFRLGGMSSLHRRAVMREALKLMNRYADHSPDPGNERKRIYSECYAAMVDAQLIEPNDNMLESIRRLYSNERTKFIFGTGYWGGWIYKLLVKSGIGNICFVDNDETLQGTVVFEHIVENPNVLGKCEGEVFITPEQYQNEIREQILSYHNERMYIILLNELREVAEDVFKMDDDYDLFASNN